ncbi:molybdopterin dehydrogenase [Sphingobium sp. SCG-1]|uniref:FAD binding domain-containing protein n=1 Tax=Sphingobium sp. SCG-1 TaxID=2072936 RepID=UPI000CD68BC8|nr:xanthine dehydrogenase family protein subunit M [Sphingobium sp. SCG-1]AUW58576.1 molybdopterin dehydrogenase [Sphingobium sp. SCG-1]
MNQFEFVQPSTAADAIGAGLTPGAAYLGAGTNLLDLMKGGIATPQKIVDITRLPGLEQIETLANGDVRIGALVRNADLAHDTAFSAQFPAVAEALLSGASPQLRNAATVGGNLLQRTRCRYFFDTAAACNKRVPDTGCDAHGGDNRSHAVLGWSEACIATHPSDFCVALAALDAIVEVEGPGGGREFPLVDLHRLPGSTPWEETILAQGDLVVAIRLPHASRAFSTHSRYIKVRERTSYAFALVSAAAALVIVDGKISRARLAFGGLAAKPWRAEAAEALLVGATPDRATFESAAKAALADAAPSGDNEYKIALAVRIAVRTLLRAAAGTPDRLPALPASPFAALAGEIHHD